MRPLIGLSTYREQAQWGVWNTGADVLPASYAKAIERAGGVPVLLPPSAAEGAAVIISRLDGLVITGGADLDPRLYAAERHPRTADWRADRDTWEWALLDAAGEAELSMLGICRGMQLMAVHAGGSLDQHTPDLVGNEDHSPGGDVFGHVDVAIEPGSRLREILGVRVTTVGCHHHQSVGEHPGFTSVARAGDGTLEAMEQPGDRFCLAVQWHPEVGTDSGLFDALVRACRESSRRG